MATHHSAVNYSAVEFNTNDEPDSPVEIFVRRWRSNDLQQNDLQQNDFQREGRAKVKRESVE